MTGNVPSDIKNLPFRVINKNNKLVIDIEYKGKRVDFTPEEILSMILVNERNRRSIPWYTSYIYYNYSTSSTSCFNYFQRQAIGDAEGIFEVIAVAGDNHLDGEDFDNRLVNHFVQEFKRKFNKDICSNARAISRLRTACEHAKRTLSILSIVIDSLFEDIDFYTSLTRARFEELNKDLFSSTIEPVEKVLRDAKIDKSQVHEIFMVVQLYEGECTRASGNNLLGSFELFGIPPAPRGVPQIKVTFDAYGNGFLNVYSAINKETVFKAEKYHAERKQYQQKIEVQNGLESYTYNLLNVVQKIDNLKNKLQDVTKNSITWIENNQEASKDECEREQKLLEWITDQIMNELCNSEAEK
ncbi:hsp71-like protein [Rhizophagus irregularis DAOM 181602=DAOM 197198]|uniref:Hsp71-like protein n=1 Tax=Rhizophagus irregularis (strain DAOM 181602 / DAOM 197198 / MUCL 43194) TaxID=747089 RepID=A0A2P4PYX8_RHIID|nr:hsp71-like protein [Rhizophagus irregularis DAOM 181602=DAOM 197198]POG70570.1 hsp71-like protein [Rhizophagus irregularis DAOM 181602=DAOM 197198]|eukprot:XP_025177436.1 hsp71-like protein [Rhizophagus irregularis DAOM 181602=DAOM 197198]